MNYGVKTRTGDKVEGLIRTANELPTGYVTITEAEYNQGQSEFNKHPALIFDFGDRIFIQDSNESTQIDEVVIKQQQRAALRAMSIELDLKVRLGESTTQLQSEFDALKLTYQA